MKKSKVKSVLLGLTAVCLLFTGCELFPYATPTPAITPEVTPTPITPATPPPIEVVDNDGVLNISIYTFDTFNPLMTKSRGLINVYGMMYTSLLTLNSEREYTLNGAREISVNEDYTVWTVTLRDDIYFHNGTRLTVDDVVYTIGLLRNSSLSASLYAFDSKINAHIKSITSNKNDNTVIFTFKVPVLYLESYLCFPIIKANTFRNASEASAKITNYKKMPQTSSMYYLSAHTTSNSLRQMTLKYSERYFGEAPLIKTVSVKQYATVEPAMNALNNGELDLYLSTVPTVQNQLTGNLKSEQLITDDLTYIVPNPKSENIDLNFKMFIMTALDREEMVRIIENSDGVVTDSLIHPSSVYYNSKLRIYDFNTALARNYFNACGFRDRDENGYMDEVTYSKKGEEIITDIELEIAVNDKNRSHYLVAEALRDVLDEYHIKAKITKLSASNLTKAINSGKYDLYIKSTVGIKENNFYNVCYGDSKSGIKNLAGYENEELNALLYELVLCNDNTRKVQIYTRLDTIFTSELPVLPMYYKTETLVTSNKLKLPAEGILGEYNIYSNVTEWKKLK
ncbi:MAG: ABC transporter substrate-binding protein [Clostridiales bacterium]|nr:ABC transporter substrate-binding protein [Clostridiales bacterium]